MEDVQQAFAVGSFADCSAITAVKPADAIPYGTPTVVTQNNFYC